MIQAQDLVKWFGPKLAVDHVSLHVEPGEILGFLGPNGAGKSTTMRLITGFLPPTEGKVSIGGHDMEDDGIAARSLVGYLPENAPAYPEMTVAGFLNFSAEIRGLRGHKKIEAVDHAVSTCSLEGVFHQTIETLSKGYLHRTCFAQAILHDPAVLVMDEPTDGLDPNQKHEVRNLIKRMGHQENKAIIISTHILEEVDAVCSRVVIINHGKIVFSGDPDELRSRSPSSGAVTVSVHGVDENELKNALNALGAAKNVAVLSKTDARLRVRVFPTRKDGRPDSGLARAVAGLLREKSWEFEELHTEKGRLDDVFRTITLNEETAQKEDAE